MRKKIGAVMLALLALISFPVSAEIQFKSLGLPDSVPQETTYYSITSIERSSHPGFLKFHVKSEHAEYDIEGLKPLIKLLHEIEVIEQVRRDEKTSGFFDGAAASVEATKDGFVNLVAHPVGSAKGIGKAAGKLGRSVGGIFRKKQEGEKSSFGEKVIGSSERELAKQFGVDVYTSNPYLRGILNSMARARAGGKGAALVVKFLIPVAGLASIALTASGVNGAADQLVNDSSRADLFRINKEALLKMGFNGDDVLSFLNNPLYSPRELTYVRVYLETLKDVEGSKEIFRAAHDAQTPTEVLTVLFSSEIAANGFKREDPYKKIEVLANGIKIETSTGQVWVSPADYLEKYDGNAGEVWNAGRIAPELASRLRRDGIHTKELFALGTGSQ